LPVTLLSTEIACGFAAVAKSWISLSSRTAQFIEAADELAAAAAREVVKYRRLFATLRSSVEVLRKQESHYRYDLAIAHGLAGKSQEAVRLFAGGHVTAKEPRDWEIERNLLTHELSTVVRDPPAFHGRVVEWSTRSDVY